MAAKGQAKALSIDLTTLNGVVILQKAQEGEFIAQAFGIPFEAKNKYQIKSLPNNVAIPTSNKSADLWKPSFEEVLALPDLFMMKEQSECCTRVFFTLCGCRAMRPMDVLVLENEEEKMKINKPCKCGGWICCPLEMTLKDSSDTQIGVVLENFSPYCSKCYECCFCCSYYHHVYSHVSGAPAANTMERSGDEPKYELKLHLCCCQGESNNCCGATCFNHNAIFEIRNPNNGEVIGNIQKLYAPATSTTCAGFGRCLAGFDTFAIQFPDGSSHEDRMMLITGVLQAEFQIFESDQD